MTNDAPLTSADLARVYEEEWGFCGCFLPEDSVELIRDVLAALDRRSEDHFTEEAALPLKDLLPGRFFQFVLDVLNRFDLTEHGGSVGGSWLSDHGRRVLAALVEYGVDPDGWEEARPPALDETVILPCTGCQAPVEHRHREWLDGTSLREASCSCGSSLWSLSHA